MGNSVEKMHTDICVLRVNKTFSTSSRSSRSSSSFLGWKIKKRVPKHFYIAYQKNTLSLSLEFWNKDWYRRWYLIPLYNVQHNWLYCYIKSPASQFNRTKSIQNTFLAGGPLASPSAGFDSSFLESMGNFNECQGRVDQTYQTVKYRDSRTPLLGKVIVVVVAILVFVFFPR